MCGIKLSSYMCACVVRLKVRSKQQTKPNKVSHSLMLFAAFQLLQLFCAKFACCEEVFAYFLFCWKKRACYFLVYLLDKVCTRSQLLFAFPLSDSTLNQHSQAQEVLSSG